MRDVTQHNFGLLIAYVLPGFIALWGVGYLSATVRSWLAPAASGGPTVGGFLYVTLASLACGLTASTMRWLLLDSLHHVTGVRRPHWEFGTLQSRLGAFELLVESHYRYYQFYGNTMVAVAFVYLMWRPHGQPSWVWILSVVAGQAILFIASRDALHKYYDRSAALLESGPTNG